MLIKLLGRVPYQKVIVIDTLRIFSSAEIDSNYINSNFDSIVNAMKKDFDKEKQIYDQNNGDISVFEKSVKKTYFIIGISNLLSKISEDSKNTLLSLIEKFKEYRAKIEK